MDDRCIGTICHCKTLIFIVLSFACFSCIVYVVCKFCIPKPLCSLSIQCDHRKKEQPASKKDKILHCNAVADCICAPNMR